MRGLKSVGRVGVVKGVVLERREVRKEDGSGRLVDAPVPSAVEEREGWVGRAEEGSGDVVRCDLVVGSVLLNCQSIRWFWVLVAMRFTSLYL